jgi:hypothetical protein
MIRLLAVASACLLLTACASASNPGAMSVAVKETSLISAESGLHKAIAAPTVTGGKETSPMWKSNVSSSDFAEALRQTLAANTMLASENGRFNLAAELVELNQPMVGLDMTVTARVKYTLTDIATGQTIWSQEIVTPYTAKMSDAFVGVKRLQLANEGAIRTNIEKLVDALIAESKTNPALAKLN